MSIQTDLHRAHDSHSSAPASLKGAGAGTLAPIGNPQQNEAITHRRGPMLCLAGPGSGKTFTLVQHILFLIRNEHILPSRILVLTFSKAAALEMQQRYLKDLKKAVGDDMPSGRPFFGTFHALFFRILKEETSGGIHLADTKTRTDLLTRLFMTYQGRKPTEKEVTDLLGKISSFKNGTLSMDALTSRDALSWNNKRQVSAAEARYYKRRDNEKEGGGSTASFESERAFLFILRDYRQFMEENHLIDFDDMALDCMALLLRSPSVLKKQQEKYDHILVDEFQDINSTQLKLTLLLCRPHGNIFVVGDDDQSIYGFRGADPYVFRRFLEAYPNARKVTLSVNYRCQAKVLNAALVLIRQNKNRMPKKITAGKKEGMPVALSGFENPLKEAEEEAKVIREYIRKGGLPSSCAVILRTHAGVEQTEKLLLSLGIPVSGTVIKVPACVFCVYTDIEGYFLLAKDLAEGHADAAGVRAVMNKPQRWFLLKDAGEGIQTPAEILSGIPERSPAYSAMREFLLDVAGLSALSPKYAVSYLRRQIGLEEYEIRSADSKDADAVKRAFDGVEAIAAASLGILDFLQALNRKVQEMRSLDGKKKSSGEGIRIMTMHACKGLEFSLVILPDLNEGVIPGYQVTGEDALEEERRLLYVAMTRARDRLCMYWVDGGGREPSRLLSPLMPPVHLLQ